MENARDQIRKWAEQEGRKLAWVASQVPVGQSDLSRWLNGHAIPRRIFRARLSQITGLEISDESAWKK